MLTECNLEQLAFEGFAGKQVVGAFDGGAVTSNAGALVLREADRAIGLTAAVARCFEDRRDPHLRVHEVTTLVAQRVHALALDYDDLNDHDELRPDPVLGLLSDTFEPKRADCATLAGKSTLNRLEISLKGGTSRYHKIAVDDAKLEQVFLDLCVAAPKTPPKRIILDRDATDDPLHGNQEGASSTATTAATATAPLYIFDGRHLLVAKLRKADMDLATRIFCADNRGHLCLSTSRSLARAPRKGVS